MAMEKMFLRQVHEKIRNIMTEAMFSVKFSSRVFMIPLINKKRKTEASAWMYTRDGAQRKTRNASEHNTIS